ncbi:hypothetical protein LCGC14_0586370 [marine sediment metagenome]|uniref:Uncharacterized protein n=1 Tax=marine sediment metagenome TaxID=412755 RepID=A0A0F9U107_9ZZZZ
MICQKCLDSDRKSRVFSDPITCMTAEVKYDNSYWDELGEFHNHNHHSYNYKCSNGHTFSIKDHCAFGDCC